MMRCLTLAAILVLACALPAAAQSTWDFPAPEPAPYHVDSGFKFNSTQRIKMIHEETTGPGLN